MVNGSPRASSCTGFILDALAQGMEEAGASIFRLNLAQKSIGHCLGCFGCWLKTPGICVLQDDMEVALQSYNQADWLVLGTPLYHGTMTGLMKNFIDRTIPTIEPWFVEDPLHPGRTIHPKRYDRPQALLLVSPCGFPEWDHFAWLTGYFQSYAAMMGWQYLGEVLRPAAELLQRDEMRAALSWYFDLVRQAGRELVTKGQIQSETRQGLRKNLVPLTSQSFCQLANRSLATQMAKAGIPEDQRQPPFTGHRKMKE